MNNFFTKVYDKHPLFFGLVFTVLVLYGIGHLISFIKGKDDSNVIVEEYIPLTPRHMKGVDTIRAHDSLYIIKFEIQKVIPNNIQNESQDKYKDDY